MKVVGYDTKKLHTTEIVKAVLKPFNGELLNIEQFDKVGLADADIIVISGILRGTGLVYKECVRLGRNFVYIDHAYFLKGYEDPNWMRMTMNRHAFGPTLVNKPGDRFQSYFASKYKLDAWKNNTHGNILILPPTNAVCWLFDAHGWLDDTVRQIKSITDRPIKIRSKPQDPIVDARGNLLRMDINESKDVPLADDIAKAHAVVAYNSNSVIEAVKQGVPVICDENCAAYPISYKLDDLRDATTFKQEPNRQQLFNDLAYSQYTRQEMQQGALRAIQQI